MLEIECNSKIKVMIGVLSVIFTISTLVCVMYKFNNYLDGDAAKIIKLYIQQSNTENALETKESLDLLGLNDSIIINSIAKFPDGTPIVAAMNNEMISAAVDLQKMGIEDKLPETVGVAKSLGETTFAIFKPTLKIKCEHMSFGKIKLKCGETAQISAYFNKVDVSQKAFIACSYDTDILKPKEDGVFEAITSGETELGILF